MALAVENAPQRGDLVQTGATPLPALAQAQHAVGLRLRDRDIDVLPAWMEGRAKALGLEDTPAYVSLLAAQNATARSERESITARLTTGETYFWRDHGHFELMQQTLLPELMARRANSRQLKLWSAGCSTGEEAYSLAMMLTEMAPALNGWKIRIHATDINSEALVKARKGVYSDWSFRALDEARKQHFFKPAEGRRWQIDTALRAQVEFKHLDLVNDRIPDAVNGLDDFDLILCRNVFIYMTPEAIGQISHKLGAALRHGGYLITGHGELLGHNTPGLYPQIHAQGVVLHKAEHGVPLPLTACRPLPEPASQPAPVPERRVAKPVARPSPPDTPQRRMTDQAELARQLVQEAWRLADQGEREAALATCQRAVAVAPLAPWPYYLQAQLAQERGDTEQARVLLNKVIYLDPDFIAAHLELASLLHQMGQPERARQGLLSARKLLAQLAPATPIAPYEQARAGDLQVYVEHLLDGDLKFAQAQAPSIRGRRPNTTARGG